MPRTPEATLEVIIVPNLQSDPFKFLAYSPDADEDIIFDWQLDGADFSTSASVSICRDCVPSKQSHKLSLIGTHTSLGSGKSEISFAFPEINKVLINVIPTLGVEFETPFQIFSTTTDCVNACSFQFHVYTQTSRLALSNPTFQPFLQNLYLPAGSFQIEVNGVNSSQIVVEANPDLDCDAIPLGAANCVLLLTHSACGSRAVDCLPFLNVTSCDHDNLLALSLLESMLSHTLPLELLYQCLTNIERISHCYVPDEYDISFRLTDGSTISPFAIDTAFRVVETILHAIEDCDLYFRVEMVMSRLALARLLYSLPGESASDLVSGNVETSIYATRRKSESTALETTIPEFEVSIPPNIVSAGRKTFRDLFVAYDSLDFTAIIVPEKFKDCRGEISSEAIGLDLFADPVENATMITYKKRQRSDMLPRCVWWDSIREIWSTEGLTLTYEDGFEVCSSTHLTVFTIMYDDIDESSQIFWCIISVFHLITLSAAFYQIRRLLNLREFKIFENTAGSVASVSHSIIVVVALLDMIVSITLLFGHTGAWVYVLRTIPFCLTVLLYTLVARQWLHIASGSLQQSQWHYKSVIALLNLGILITTLVLTICAIVEIDIEFFGVFGVIFISALCSALLFTFIGTGVGVLWRVRQMSRLSGTKVPVRVLNRLIIAATSISSCFAILCVLNAMAGADANWFQEEYALVQGFFLGARIAVLWVVIYLHKSIIQKLEQCEDEGGVNPLDCIVPTCTIRRVEWSLSFTVSAMELVRRRSSRNRRNHEAKQASSKSSLSGYE